MQAKKNITNYAGKCWLVATVLLNAICFSACRAQTNAKPLLSLAPGSPISMNCSPGNLAAGDFDNDGKADLVVACASNRSLSFFKGNGDGTFAGFSGPALTLPYPPHELALGDMNKDGNIDIVVGSHDYYTVLILRGSGTIGGFMVRDSVVMRSSGHPHTHGLGLGDMNGDGLPDIVTANSNDHDIAVMLNKGNLQFSPAPGSPFAVGPDPYPLTIGDLNNDGHPDIISTSTNRSFKALTLLINDGKANFQRRDIPLRTASAWYVAIGDINKDQIPDLAMTHAERNELTVLIGNNNGQFTEAEQSPFNLGSSAWALALSDINHDDLADVLAAANTGIRLMLSNGKGQFALAPGSPLPTGRGSWHLAITDVNNDGRPDVITSNLESNNVSVLISH